MKSFLPLALLAILPYANAQTITVIQPDTPGLQLIGSQSPDFAAAAAAVVSAQTLQQLAPYLPLAAVFKNASAQPLMAYTIRWTVDNNPDPHTGAGIGSSSSRNTQGYLQPGAAVLAIPDFLLKTDPGPASLRALRQQESRMQSDWETAKTIAISLDSAIFASGQYVGPDTANLFAKDAAYTTAWRAVDVNVQTQIAEGIPFVAIAAGLQEIRDRPFSNGAEALHDWTGRAQSQEARIIIDLYDRRGAQAVSDLIKRNLAMPEITVHR